MCQSITFRLELILDFATYVIYFPFNTYIFEYKYSITKKSYLSNKVNNILSNTSWLESLT